ncbi:hypothetical protein F3J16_06465 [Burkholderia sp. Ap-962]|uniref:hypothetical protein n=1 Tax=Burkholderia sp. Ap-962 TaxID=2608333 RepID=UPI00141E7EC9|nr:hypothetical protein [Burkholderia sp. Ap-962]NIF69835.1 hypothetical protein [Burkholderia sp. Ap-962]
MRRVTFRNPELAIGAIRGEGHGQVGESWEINIISHNLEPPSLRFGLAQPAAPMPISSSRPRSQPLHARATKSPAPSFFLRQASNQTDLSFPSTEPREFAASSEGHSRQA